MERGLLGVLLAGLTSCALGHRYRLVEPLPVTRSGAVAVRALEVGVSYSNEITVRLAVSGVDGRVVVMDPNAIGLGLPRPAADEAEVPSADGGTPHVALPKTDGKRFGDAMTITGQGVLLLFPIQAAMYGMSAAAEAIDDGVGFQLEPGEQLVVLRYSTVTDGTPIALQFDSAITGAAPPQPLTLLVPDRPHSGLSAPRGSSGMFGVFLGGGPVYVDEDAPLGRRLAPTRAQAGIELYAGWRFGERLAVVGVSRLLGLGTTLGLDVRVTALRTEVFELTPFAGYGFTIFAADKQFAAQVGRIGFNTTYFLRREDPFGFDRRLIGLGTYTHVSGRWVHGRLVPAFEVGLSVALF